MRSRILGLIIATSIAAGFAHADESDQKDGRWTGFYVGANGGLAQSDSKETSTFGARGSAVSESPNSGVGTFPINLTGHDLQTGSLGMGSESNISKALGFGKSK